MGQSSAMKAFIFSAVLALAAADTCTDCTAVVNFIAARLTTEESIAAQSAVLVGGLCPTTEDPAACEAGLPGFWAAIAVILWPGYYDPNAEWMCAPICAAPEDTVMTCDDCKMGVQAGIDQMLAPETLDTIVEFLSGDFCATTGEDRCPEFVDVIIRQGLPMIYAASDDAAVTETCNAAVEGTCPTKLRLF